MIEIYDEIFEEYKSFIEQNSQYEPRVVKYYTNTSTHFPIISFILSNDVNTDNATIDKIEYYDEHYYTIDIYTQNKTKGANIVTASQVINDELSRLTMQFFDNLNMKRTLCRPTPNLDKSVLRKTIQYQCLVGNVRKNIIRR